MATWDETAIQQELLRRAAAHDPAAVQQLLAVHRRRLQRMVRVHLDERLVGRVDASDVVQEALLEAIRRIGSYLAAPPLPFYPWLRQIAWERLVHLHARHLWADRRAVGREGGRLALPDGSAAQLADRLAAATTSPSGRVLRDELRHRVRAALVQVPEGERDVLVLHYLEQLTFGEVAAVLGISEAAACKRHVRGLERLRGLLGT